MREIQLGGRPIVGLTCLKHATGGPCPAARGCRHELLGLGSAKGEAIHRTRDVQAKACMADSVTQGDRSPRFARGLCQMQFHMVKSHDASSDRTAHE